MTIGDLERWRDDNGLADTWYLEVNEQGIGKVMTLEGVGVWARHVWREGGQIRVVHVSMAGSEANWVTLYPEVKPEHQCPACGTNCEALVGSFPGRGITCGEWFGIAALVVIVFWAGATGAPSMGGCFWRFFRCQ